MDVRVGFGVDDLSDKAVPAFLKTLDPILTAPTDTAWNLDLASAGERAYFGPTAAVVVASSFLLAKHRNQRATVALPRRPLALSAFCAFSGLTHLVATGQIASPPDSDHPVSETAPLQQFHRMNWGGSTPMVRLIRRHLPGLGSDSEDLLRACYSEIAQNIEDHAESPIGGVICARYFTNLKEIRIAVVDRGMGIGERLRRSEAVTSIRITSDQHALELVLGGDVSSKSRPNNMGQGISNLGLMARGNGGCLMIVSGLAIATVDSRSGTRVRPLACAFPGTLVSLSLRVADGDTRHDQE